MNGDGSSVRQLNRQWVYSVVWSPDGRKIAFVSAHAFDAEGNPSGGTDIWMMDVESKKQFNLTNSEELIEYAPSWSPDGKQIAFQAAPPNDAYQIFIINADGAGPKQLTTRGRNSNPVWGRWGFG